MKRSVIITTSVILLGLAIFIACFLMSRDSESKRADVRETVTTEEPVVTGWVTEDAGTMYLNSAGDATKGIAEIDGKAYVFDDEGILLSGWQENVSDEKIYVNQDGTLASGWTKINDFIYYFNDDGTPYSGWLTDLGKRYYIKN